MAAAMEASPSPPGIARVTSYVLLLLLLLLALLLLLVLLLEVAQSRQPRPQRPALINLASDSRDQYPLGCSYLVRKS